jgi:hypothetical protein
MGQAATKNMFDDTILLMKENHEGAGLAINSNHNRGSKRGRRAPPSYMQHTKSSIKKFALK